MKKLFLFLLLTSSFWSIQAQEDYKKYLRLSYAEIDSLMYIEYNQGTYDKAIPLMQAGKEKAKKEFGEVDSVFVTYISNLGFFYEATGQYEKALPIYIQNKKLREKLLGIEHPQFAAALNNLASLYQSMGNYELALPLYIQCININEKVLGIEDPEFAIYLHNLATLHQSMGNYELALPLYVQSKNIREKVLGVEHPDFANSITGLAVIHKDMGNDALALSLFVQSKNIYEKILGIEHPDFAKSLHNLAALHQSMGNYESALPLYIRSKNIREKVLGVEHPDFAESLNNLAALHQNMGNYELALPLFIQSKDIREKVQGRKHPLFAYSLNNLAELHQNMGHYELASIVVGLAMNSMSNLKLNHTFKNSWLDSLKNAPYSSNDHLDNMINSLRIAYQLLEKDSSILDVANKQMNIADLATTLLEKSRNQAFTENDKLRFLGQSNDWLQKSLTVLSPHAHVHKAFNLSDQNKSVLLLQATKSETAYRLGELPDSLIVQDKKLLKKQSQLEAKLLENRSKAEKDSLRNELNHVNQNIGDFVEIIKKNYPKYHRLKYQQIDVKVEEIQALLDDNTALLEYVIGDSVVHVFLVDKKQVQWKKSFVGNKELTDNIKTLHQSLSDYELVTKDKEKAYRSYTQNAHWFYQKLIDPVLKDKKGIDNLIIVSDGELGHLPFETFLMESAPQPVTDYHLLHYLVNDYNISYNYSATLWKENKEAPAAKNNGQILAMAANYDIKLDSSMMNVRLPTDQWLREVLKPLPAARKEVETLQEKYQGFFAFDALASEKTVKEKAGDFAILHFAMHGILDAKRPMLSSLAFTEDNDSTESNFWQAHEISKMELNANLVVLSACETGYGKFEKGNGIASLSRAFMYAGASALIVSLWQVNDYATSEIMKNLYANLANGMKKDEALRQAKIQYMKEAKGVLTHPAFWSPFILMGNTDAIYLKTKGGWFWWLVGGGVLALGSGVFVMRRERKING